jgi:hypothetical protein
MGKMIDANCNIEFDSEEYYLIHKKSGHQGSLDHAVSIETPPIPTPPPGVPKDALPSKEFMETINRIEQKKNTTPPAPSTPPSRHPTELPEVKSVQLTYKFIGECPEHRVAVDTLELDILNKHFCVAVCPSCRKQLLTREVAKL